jgi:hypothetical protein
MSLGLTWDVSPRRAATGLALGAQIFYFLPSALNCGIVSVLPKPAQADVTRVCRSMDSPGTRSILKSERAVGAPRVGGVSSIHIHESRVDLVCGEHLRQPTSAHITLTPSQ